MSGACADCGRRYGDQYGFPDLMIEDWAWEKISPTGHEGGLLCPSCICRRLHQKNVRCSGLFLSGPLMEDRKMEQQIKMCDICRKDSNDLRTLRKPYKTKDVEEVCPACEKIINTQLRKIQILQSQMTSSLMRRFIDLFRSKKGKNDRLFSPILDSACKHDGYIPEEDSSTPPDPPRPPNTRCFCEGRDKPKEDK